jgi:hypothetical protein
MDCPGNNLDDCDVDRRGLKNLNRNFQREIIAPGEPLSSGHTDEQYALDLFDGLVTLCYIELPRGKFSAATLFARFANLCLASIKCRRRHDDQHRFQEP